MNSNFYFACQSLLKQKTRTILTVLAISIGIALVVTVFAAGAGLDGVVKSELNTFGAGVIEIEVKVPNVSKTSNENASGMALGNTITTFKNNDVEAMRENKNIKYIYGAMMGQEAIGYGDELKKMFLFGAGFEAPLVDDTEVKQGRFFTKEEEYGLSRVAVLGHGAWQKLFNGAESIGEYITIKGKKYRVIGILAERGSAFFFNLDDMVYLPLRTFQKRIMGVDYVTFAVAKMVDPNRGQQTQLDLTQIMREQHDITTDDFDKDDFAVNTMDEAADMLGNVVQGITFLLVALVCISLVVGGVGIMNIMYVSVAERTFEIGLRKSVGAGRPAILWQFLFEALLITFSGGAAGIIFGAILSYLVAILARSYGLSWIYHVSFFSIFISVGFSVLIGFIFGLYPARKAAALNPIEALHRE
ncbi:MAG: ABC transporter permease [Candidatus Magasanikbacteria bacterium]|nr:ABC transporter permease [Candidatus Magasanikbacteria bacterium]